MAGVYPYNLKNAATMYDSDSFIIVQGTELVRISKKILLQLLNTLNEEQIEKIENLSINGNGALLLDNSGSYRKLALEDINDLKDGVGDIINSLTVDNEGNLCYNNTQIGTVYELPIASDTVLGGIKIDNDTIKINEGVISADVIGNWSAGISYPVGYFVVYDNALYQCIVANNDDVWTESNWAPIGSKASETGMTIDNWATNTEYAVGNLVINETTIYQCNTAHTSGETFDETNWTAMTGAKGDKGEDGFSPIANVVTTETGATITITDATETTTVDITNGTTPHIDDTTKHWFIGETDTNIVAEGKDGASPTATITKTDTGVTITVVSGEQTTTAELTNGITTIQTTSVKYTGTLAADGWAGDTVPYTQTIAMDGITSDIVADFGIVITKDNVETALEEKKQWGYITSVETIDGGVVFYCFENKPTIVLNYQMRVV